MSISQMATESNGSETPCRLEGHITICDDWHQCLIVQELMACCARKFDFEEFAVRKAIKEALSNALKHGNGGAPDKCIRIDYKMDESEFQVTITDEGTGFDHFSLTNTTEHGNGHGLGLMRHYMTHVRFNDQGNRVVLAKLKTKGGGTCFG